MLGAAEQLRCSTGCNASTSYSTVPASGACRLPWPARAPAGSAQARLGSADSAWRSGSLVTHPAQQRRRTQRCGLQPTRAASTVPTLPPAGVGATRWALPRASKKLVPLGRAFLFLNLRL